PGQRGRSRVYGDRRIDLAKRAGQRRGWATGTFDLYGEPTVKRYKTFVATWRPAGGAIRVVLVDEPTGWRAYFCTDVSASVADVLETVADRFALETAFRDCKEVVGAGQQQVRFVWASVGRSTSACGPSPCPRRGRGAARPRNWRIAPPVPGTIPGGG